MIKNILAFFLLSFIFAPAVFCQSRQSLFAEFGGQGSLFTLNYDTRLTNEVDGIGMRVGACYMKTSKVNYLRLPIGVNYLIGDNGKFMELGLGATFGNSNILDSESHTIGTLCFGYRVQPPEGGLCYRVALTPYFTMGSNSLFIPYFGGISVGYAF